MANTPPNSDGANTQSNSKPTVPDGKSSAEFTCLTSLIFITHPLVLKEIYKLTDHKLIEIKALKDGSQKWQAGDGHVDNKMTSDNIDLLYYILKFDGPVIENHFVADMEKTNMPASISDRKIISGKEGLTEVKTLKPENTSAVAGRTPSDISATVEQDGVEASAIVQAPGKRMRRVRAKIPLKSTGREPTSKEIGEAKNAAVKKVARAIKTITAETFELGIKKINDSIEDVEEKMKGCGENECDDLKEELKDLKLQREKFYEYVKHQEETMK